LTGKDWRRLKRACDEVLAEGSRYPDILAIHWLHVLHQHPSQVSRYEGIFSAERRGQFGKEVSIRPFLVILFKMIMAWLRPFRFPELPGGRRLDALVISHRMGGEKRGADFCLGDLPNDMARRGRKVLSLCFDYRPKAIWKNHGLEIRGPRHFGVSLPKWADGLTEVRGVLGMWGLSRLFAPRAKASSGWRRRFFLRLSREAWAPANFTALRTSHWVRHICRSLRPRHVLVTWEGHAWERLALQAARAELGKKVCTHAVQHTVTFPGRHASARSLGRDADPDVFWATSPSSRIGLPKPWTGYGRFHVLGTPRMPKRFRPPAQRLRPVCLVVPEGIPSEIKILMDFTQKIATEAKEFTFLIRLHPLFHLQRRGLPMGKSAKNVSLSLESLETDLRRSSWILYRGSSVVFQAIARGVRPIHLRQPDDLAFDPCHGMGAWTKTVSSPTEALRFMRMDSHMDRLCRGREWRKGSRQAGFFLSPLNPKVERRLISLVA